MSDEMLFRVHLRSGETLSVRQSTGDATLHLERWMDYWTGEPIPDLDPPFVVQGELGGGFVARTSEIAAVSVVATDDPTGTLYPLTLAMEEDDA